MTTLPALYDNPAALPEAHRGAVLVIGNFDGVHIGHERVIANAAAHATKIGAPLGVMMFEPHPRAFFTGGASHAPSFRLTKVSTRRRLLAQHNIDFMLVMAFDAELAACAAQDFITAILVRQLEIAAVAVGHDFRFGHKRGGDTAMLSEFAAAYDFEVLITPAVMEAKHNEPYSSSAIRAALVEGDAPHAAALLGRCWGIEGVICEGDKRGRTINFPTINMALEDYLQPRFGVYAVRAEILSGNFAGEVMNGVANLGLRPTIEGGAAARLESHLFDFSGDLYGAVAFVALHQFIRPEQKFASLEALAAQIGKDAAKARTYFAGK